VFSPLHTPKLPGEGDCVPAHQSRLVYVPMHQSALACGPIGECRSMCGRGGGAV
jgi:hypothetical protein